MGLCSLFLSPQDELEKEEKQGKTVNLELVFGYHWKPGSGTSVRCHRFAAWFTLRPRRCVSSPPPTASAFHFDHSSGKLSTISPIIHIVSG